ncbi:MAG: c-type cytochrome biogenesis protein CcsB [Pseudomonadota bacterium]
MTGSLVLALALLAYLLSAAGFIVFGIRQNKKAARGAHGALAAGFGLQTIHLAVRTVALGQLPVLNMFEALAFFGWVLAGVYLLVQLKFKLHILGALASPLTVVLVFGGVFFGAKPETVSSIYKSVWLTLHLAGFFTGYGFFGLAFVAGVMYLFQEQQIKSKRPGPVFRRLPSLNILDHLNQYCLSLGFPFMTLGLITGAVYAQVTLGKYWRWDPKEVWSLILWLVYAALLHQRLTVGWRGRRAAVMAIVGFSVLCFTFVGVSLLLPGYHTFENLERLRTQ